MNYSSDEIEHTAVIIQDQVNEFKVVFSPHCFTLKLYNVSVCANEEMADADVFSYALFINPAPWLTRVVTVHRLKSGTCLSFGVRVQYNMRKETKNPK